MTVDRKTLNILCPMHAVLDADGLIVQAGPTLQKLRPDLIMAGTRFLEIFEVERPRAIRSMKALRATAGRKLHMRFRDEPRTAIKGLMMADDTSGGAVVNLSFGIAVSDAVRDYRLTSADFAVTDLAVEMLYLIEAKSAAMQASRKLNERLQTAMLAAEERSFTDNLTGLRNRRAMELILDRMISGREPFAVMHVDLDFFKEVNDTLGHAAGDHVLQHVSRQMQKATRSKDVVTRVGGDEFVILLEGISDAGRLAEIAADIISETKKPIFCNGEVCRVSASIGITTQTPDGTGTSAETMERADIALYQAKRAGRAQYVMFDPEMRDRRHASVAQKDPQRLAGE